MARGAPTDKNTVGNSVMPGRRGGTLRRGNPGNKGGGRKPKAFKDWCHELTHDEVAQEVYRARNRAGDLDVLKFAASYDQGKPQEKTEVTGDLTVRIVRE